MLAGKLLQSCCSDAILVMCCHPAIQQCVLIFQIGEGLNFLHNDAKKIHHNLCPHNIILSQHGAWKIFGFDFCRELVSRFFKVGYFFDR